MRMLPAGRVTAPALRGLSRFADTRGLPASRESWLDYDVIEAFCVAGLTGRASSTRGTYRSALYRLAEAMHGPAGQGGGGGAQRDPVKRSSALALVVFGIGAGLRPGELVALRGGDVFRHGRQVMVQVSGPTARVVPVTWGYAGRAWELARRRLEAFINSLIDASISVLTGEERAPSDGCTGLDATRVPLFSRGPSKRAGLCASDPDGGWYVREGDHREREDDRASRCGRSVSILLCKSRQLLSFCYITVGSF